MIKNGDLVRISIKNKNIVPKSLLNFNDRVYTVEKVQEDGSVVLKDCMFKVWDSENISLAINYIQCGDLVKIIDNRGYKFFENFLKINKVPNYEDRFDFNIPLNMVGKVVAITTATGFCKDTIYAIEDIDTLKLYIVDETQIKKVEL